MKIAIVRQRYNPYGGAERFVERALSALSSEGAEVSLITRSWAGAPAGGAARLRAIRLTVVSWADVLPGTEVLPLRPRI